MGKTRSSNVTIVDNAQRVVNVDFQLLVAERDDLLEAEVGYKNRIERMEKEAAETLHSFDILYNENRILRTKLDRPDGAAGDSVESYNDVFYDREHLREANRAFKRRIRQLEDDTNTDQAKYLELQSKYQLATQKVQLETEFATRARDEKIVVLEKDQDEMDERLNLFLKEREQYEYRIADMDKERNELQNKYDRVTDEKHEYNLRCDVLQEDRERLKQKATDLEDKIPDSEIKAKEEQQYFELQAQVVALQIANTDATKQIHNLNEEIRGCNKPKKEKVEMVNRALSAIVDEEQIVAEMGATKSLDNTILELEELRKRSYYVINENDKLKDDTLLLQRKLESSEANLAELRKELEMKTSQIEETSMQIRGGDRLSEEYLALLEKNKDLIAMNRALENELTQEKKLAKLKYMELGHSLEKYEEKFKQTDKEKMKMDLENKKLLDENSNQTNVIDAQALELRNMKAQIEQTRSMLDEKTRHYDEMKETVTEEHEELQESRINLHVTRHELASLQMEKAGHFYTLQKEMETANSDRKEESEQMRLETIRLREEVQKLKDYEYKITTMDSEIRRLMNRLRMSERFRKMTKKNDRTDEEREEIKGLKKKQKDLEKENNQLVLEKRQWDNLRKKYGDLITNNRRLVEENKRVRGDLDESDFKVDHLEKRYRKMSVKTETIKCTSAAQKATYIEKDSTLPMKQTVHVKSATPSMLQASIPATLGVSTKCGIKPVLSRSRRKFERKTTRMSSSRDKSSLRSTKPILPAVASQSSGHHFGKGYRDLHSKKPGKTNHLSLL